MQIPLTFQTTRQPRHSFASSNKRSTQTLPSMLFLRIICEACIAHISPSKPTYPSLDLMAFSSAPGMSPSSPRLSYTTPALFFALRELLQLPRGQSLCRGVWLVSTSGSALGCFRKLLRFLFLKARNKQKFLFQKSLLLCLSSLKATHLTISSATPNLNTVLVNIQVEFVLEESFPMCYL